MHLVHAARGRWAATTWRCSLDVGAGARLAVHSAGATLVQPGAATDAPRGGRSTSGSAGRRPALGARVDGRERRGALESQLRVTLLAGASAIVADGVRWAWTPLGGPGAVLPAVGTPAAVTAVLDAASVRPAAVPSTGGSAPPTSGVGAA